MAKDSAKPLQAQFLDAAVGDADWLDVISDVTSWVGGDKALLLVAKAARPFRCMMAYNHDCDLLELYNSHLNHEDPRANAARKTPIGACCSAQQYLRNEEISHTDYFNTVHVAGNIKDSIHGVLFDNAFVGRVGLSIHRRFDAEFFDSDNIARMSAVLPGLAKALALSKRVAVIRYGEDRNTDRAHILINAMLEVQPLHGDAPALLKECLGVEWQGGRLNFARAAVRKSFAVAVSDCLAGHEITLHIDCGGDRSLAFVFAPLPRSLAWLTDERRSVVLHIVSTDCDLREMIGIFATAFRLSARESDILTALMNHANMRLAASALDISYETLRWHLKTIMHKTGYCRRDDLLIAVRRGDMTNAVQFGD